MTAIYTKFAVSAVYSFPIPFTLKTITYAHFFLKSAAMESINPLFTIHPYVKPNSCKNKNIN